MLSLFPNYGLWLILDLHFLSKILPQAQLADENLKGQVELGRCTLRYAALEAKLLSSMLALEQKRVKQLGQRVQVITPGQSDSNVRRSRLCLEDLRKALVIFRDGPFFSGDVKGVA